MPDCAYLLVLLGVLALVQAQYQDDFGPAPPRLQIPGAVPLGPAPRRLVARPPGPQGPGPATRLRARPAGRRLPAPAAPAPQPSPVPQYYAPAPSALLPQRPQSEEPFIPPKPVVEDADDDFDEDFPSTSRANFSPSPRPPTPPPQQPQRPVPAFRPEPRPAVLPTLAQEYNFVSPARQQQLRPSVSRGEEEEEEDEEEEPRKKPAYNRQDQTYNSRNKARPTEDTQQPPRQSLAQAQYTRAQTQNVVRVPQKAYGASGKQQDYEKPVRQHQRPRKPVAQVLRKYRDDNPDGSITWGFENDDGSFKEETIGTDCVTYGKYGYIDPDGTRREYSYSTGIPCDKNKTDSEEQPSEGYVDYAENKYFLPNGDSVDLDKMVKNRARKPVQQYRNSN